MWTIIATQDEASWLDDLIEDVVTREPPALPAHDLWVGHVECSWYEVEPGVIHVASNPETGTITDRRFAERLIFTQLANSGFKQASTDLVWDHSDLRRHAAWADIEDKARRLIQSGQVQLLRNGYDTIVGQVQGDHGNYRTEIRRNDPNSNSITGSHCPCDWGQFQNLPRTRQWKRFQNRPCAHSLATYWLAKSVPIDEERAPGNQGEPGQMSLFDMSGGQPSGQMGIMRNSPMPNPNAWFMQPGAPPNAFNQPGMPPQPAQAPSPADALPQFPGEEMQMQMPPINPASVPGGRPGPTPTNPLQYPGGTFSSVRVADQQYTNGQLVRLRQETVGTLVGRSEEHGAGQSTTIPAGSVGEVLGTDPATSLCNVLFMGHQFDQNGPLEPYGATAWCWQSELTPSNLTPPGPAIRRIP